MSSALDLLRSDKENQGVIFIPIDQVNNNKGEKTGGPLPYVQSFSQTGELTIGWTQELQVPDEPGTIEITKMVIERPSSSDFLFDSDDETRLLQSAEETK